VCSQWLLLLARQPRRTPATHCFARRVFFLVFVLIMVASVIHPVWRTKWRWGRRAVRRLCLHSAGRHGLLLSSLDLGLLGEGYGVYRFLRAAEFCFVAVGILSRQQSYDACYFQGRQK